MDWNRNLLLAALCLQAGRINVEQFAAVSRECAERLDVPLEDILIDRGWLQPADKPHLDHLLNRYLHEHGNNAQETRTHLLANTGGLAGTLERLVPESTIAFSPSLPADQSKQGASIVSNGEPRYGFTSVHATGGMGRVWLARDHQLDREVALKELHPEKADNPKTSARFIREALLTGQLEHPGIVPVYELNTGLGQASFYTMRFVRGETLRQAIQAYHVKRTSGQAEPMELVDLLTAFVAVCNTVAYAHSRRVLHRDLKGDNVMLGDFGEVVVLDWGVAKRMDQSDDEPSDLSADSLFDAQNAGLTIQGEIVGTPAYMAPEQAEGRLYDIDERTDVYGLGAMLYEILTGQPPFVGTTTLEVLSKARRGDLAPPRELSPDVHPALEEICLKALSRDPAGRFARADELGQAVQQWQDVQRRRAEDALRRQTEVLRSILNSMSEGVLVSDEMGKLMLVNPAAERMIGILSGTTIVDSSDTNEYFKPDQITRFAADELPLSRAIRGEEVNDVDLFIRPLAGEKAFWASASARPIRDEAGELRGGVVVFRDITERKQAEAELVRSRERFELAVRGSQDGLWDWDPRTGEIYYSPRWKSILGYEDHEIGQRIEEWEQRLHPDDRERVLAVNQAHIDGVTPHYECEYRLRHKDGSYRWILARGVSLRDANGAAYRIAGSHVDITDRKLAEEARARSLL